MASIERLERMILDRIKAAREARGRECLQGSWSFSPETGLYRWSRDLYLTLGLEPGEEYRPYGGLVSLCNPESAALVGQLEERYRRKGLAFSAPVLITVNGDTRALTVTGAPLGPSSFGGIVTRSTG